MIYRNRTFFLVVIIFNFLTVFAKVDNNNFHINESGIKWTSGLTWSEIQKKAHDENKYIFLDCFATWCQPCKVMDRQVYPNDTVGNLMNRNFICVRVQMDSTKNDSEEVRKWYTTVKSIKKDYSVDAMPSFLFFSPKGLLVHKEVGGRNIKQFISLVTSVTNPANQYYTLLSKYKDANLEYELMPGLANMAISLGERELGNQIARKYMTDFLEQDDYKFFTKVNQWFIHRFYEMLRSSDREFKLFLQQPAKMDSLVGEIGESKMIVDFVITKEEINPVINRAKKENTNPSWRKIAGNIRKKYGPDYAERTTVNAKIRFYKLKKDHTQYSRYLVRKMEMESKNGSPESKNEIILNDNAWEVFLYGNRQVDLKKALDWSNRSLKLINPASINVGAYMDTRANILYKLGRITEAIKQEEQALQRIRDDAEKYRVLKRSIDDYVQTMEDMKKRQPTHLADAYWTEKTINRLKSNVR